MITLELAVNITRISMSDQRTLISEILDSKFSIDEKQEVLT